MGLKLIKGLINLQRFYIIFSLIVKVYLIGYLIGYLRAHFPNFLLLRLICNSKIKFGEAIDLESGPNSLHFSSRQ